MSGFYVTFYDERDNELCQSAVLAPVPRRGESVTLPCGEYRVGWVEWDFRSHTGNHTTVDTVIAAVFLTERVTP